MYGYGYPGYPVYGYQGNNDGFSSGWFWIIIVIFIIFFLFWGNEGRGNSNCCN